MNYQVIEDNAGQLYLFIFEGERVVRGIENLEYLSFDDFQASLDDLNNGGDASDWDGQLAKPRKAYRKLTSYEFGWEIVATESKVYPERMGAAAERAFGVREE